MSTTLHASGLHSASNADVRAQVAAWIEKYAPRYLTHTEAGPHRSALTLHDGHGVIHPRGDDGQSECAIQFRVDGPPFLSSKAVRLSSLPIPRRGGKLCYVTYGEFADHHHIAGHMPSGVEGAGGLLDNEQGRVYRDAIGGLRRFVAGLDGPCIISMDWNISLKSSWVPAYLSQHFPDFTWTVVPATEPGTHGTRLIDFSLVRGYTSTGDVIGNPTSDHRAIRETHKETPVSRTPKTDALVAALRRRGVEVLTHDQWASQHAEVYHRRLDTHPHGLLPASAVDTLWNHVTVTLDHGPLTGNFKADVRTVERIGFERFGSGVSYNLLVDQNAPHPRVALGQFLEAKGTHTVNDKGIAGYSFNQNKVALAVAWLGMPGDQLNAHAREAIVQINAALIEIGALTKTYDNVPHSLVTAKDCPTDELRDQLPAIKSDALAAVKPPPTVTPTPRWDALWEKANELAHAANDLAESLADGTPRDAAAREIRNLARAARTAAGGFSTKH